MIFFLFYGIVFYAKELTMNNNLVVFGAQWGDEGKGRFVDYLSAQADAVVRFQGGNNAGHTVAVDNKYFKLRLIPSGILYPHVLNVVANGVVVDVKGLFKEVDNLKKDGISCDNLVVSDRAHIVFPYHNKLDELSESKRSASDKIGTTKNGIGPAYMDKEERSGIRVCDFVNENVFPSLLKKNVEAKNELIQKVYGEAPIDYEALLEEYTALAKRLKPYVRDTVTLLNNMVSQGKKILFEGAQGALLDIDFGTYPFVTSSHPSSIGVPSGTGLSPKKIDSVVGVVKAYTSRVGAGPFVTELFDETGDFIREKGGEFGTVTGRPRRIGWLDLVVVKHSALISGMDQIALTRVDTLAGVKKLKICVAYELDGKIIDHYPADLETLSKCKPVYKEFDGWDDSISKIRKFEDLPDNVKNYVAAIEQVTGAKVCMIGVGPNRDEAILIKNPYDL